MARTAGERARHRDEQRRYRARMKAAEVRVQGVSEGASPAGPIPQTAAVDDAIVVALYGIVRRMAAKDRAAGVRAREGVVKEGTRVLSRLGFDPARSEAVLRRRLSRPPERFDALLGLDARDWDYALAP